MTKSQRITLMAKKWPAACRAQGWDADNRELRLQIFSQAVGRELASASDLNNTTDVDRVFARLGQLSSELPPVLKSVMPGEDRAARLRWKIREELLPCLGVYIEQPAAYLTEIIKDKFKRGSLLEPLTLDDLTDVEIFYRNATKPAPSQLDQLIYTLSRTIQTKRTAAGDTLHGMKLKAGVECHCATHCRKTVTLETLAPVDETELNPF